MSAEWLCAAGVCFVFALIFVGWWYESAPKQKKKTFDEQLDAYLPAREADKIRRMARYERDDDDDEPLFS